MNLRVALALSAALVVALSPYAASAGGHRPSDSTPAMLTLNHLAKQCTDGPDGEVCGPTFYVDWDGKIYKETNKKLGLQRGETLDGVKFIKPDSTDLLA